jgi:SKICH domain
VMLVQVLSHPPELPVMFEPCGNWFQLANNKVTYTVLSDFPVNSWDWIGLYKVY